MRLILAAITNTRMILRISGRERSNRKIVPWTLRRPLWAPMQIIEWRSVESSISSEIDCEASEWPKPSNALNSNAGTAKIVLLEAGAAPPPPSSLVAPD